MKTIVILLVTLLTSSSLFSQDLLTESKKPGLISYLTTVKSVAEFKMISLASVPQYKTDLAKAKNFQSEYNLLKLTVDRLINQIVADMTVKNRLKEYKKTNKYIKGDSDKLRTCVSTYKNILEDIDKRIESFMQKTYVTMLVGPTIGEILGAVELTHGIITDARDFRAKKVANISSQLIELKLKSLKELTEEKK